MKSTSPLIGLSTILAIILIFYLTPVVAVPQGAGNLTVSNSGRNAAQLTAPAVQAEAGNVTAVVISGVRVTRAWQGYYGNVTGTIVLDDAANFSLYDWQLPDPSGEVYAANSTSVDWDSIYCINVTQNGSVLPRPDGSVASINGTQIELNFGLANTDTDGLDETFNDTFAGSLEVGTLTFDGTDGCSVTHPFTDEQYTTDWTELIFSDNVSIVFGAILRSDANSFQPGSAHTADFQMLVLENGQSDAQAAITTPYYFYTELS